MGIMEEKIEIVLILEIGVYIYIYIYICMHIKMGVSPFKRAYGGYAGVY